MVRLEKEYNTVCRDDEIFCLIGAKSETPSILLWGDSHAGHLEYGLNKILRNQNTAAISISKGGCPPIMNIKFQDETKNRKCLRYSNLALDYLSSNQKIETVILAARWSRYNEIFVASEKHHIADSVSSLGDDWLVEREKLAQTINRIVGLQKSVIVVTQAPQFKENDKARECRMEFLKGYHVPKNCNMNEEDHIAEQFKMDEWLSDVISDSDRATIADVKQLFCEGQNCSAFEGDSIYYYDYNHLNSVGSSKVAHEVLSELLFSQ
ncbi:hypothetical protein GCM10007094_02120 [Pseudovibrio japonicus]|uniref:SGNH domain-containing protein n=2 Tax=Pseudovibrio japonicus TaxID=366534 RepID=A0ABQ3DVZ0_9HYPH|nr:hypothetical protein GCM10007094_02120 [Pseudovibrio japonicus]